MLLYFGIRKGIFREFKTRFIAISAIYNKKHELGTRRGGRLPYSHWLMGYN